MWSAGPSSFTKPGAPLPAYKTAMRTRALAWAARRFGNSLIMPLMLAEEGREVQAYLGMARQSTDRLTHAAAVDIAVGFGHARAGAVGGHGA